MEQTKNLENRELLQLALESYEEACNEFDDDKNQEACVYIGELYNRLTGRWEQTNHTAEEGIWNAFLDEIEKDVIKTALVRVAQFYHTQRLQEIIGELEDIEEADGEMPDELWEDIKNDKESCTEVVRFAIRQTKEEAITLLQNHIDHE